MGKNFPKITNLKDNPEFFEKTLKLIETSFKYQPPFSFKEDFASLVESQNLQNCFILIDEAESVLAHVGAKDRTVSVNGKSFTVTMLGGISVEEKVRGAGHLQTLLQDVIAEKRDACAFFLLWSDLEKLYNKFGFYLCGNQFEVDQSSEGKTDFFKTKFHLLTQQEQSSVARLYETSFSKTYLTLNRSRSDWENVPPSADLYLRKATDGVTDYFFMNKGQDLPGVVYEYGGTGDVKQLIRDSSRTGKVWMGEELLATENSQYQFFLSPGDLKLFTEFIREYSDSRISIRNINSLKQEVFFDFSDELYSLEMEDFLRGMFGPGTFEELVTRPLFISGLDSI
ncbi:MAG TPA: GNAT family N-acetyltransferase [Bacteriovoracaceae bacterium]|nr:GNAT family N-acetyltransferase [Bacteriovoracaceae bacterium]